MKAEHVDGYGDKWLINLEYNPWNPAGKRVYRVNGIAQAYDTEADADAVIATLQAQGEQGALNMHREPVHVDAKPRKVRDTTGGEK